MNDLFFKNWNAIKEKDSGLYANLKDEVSAFQRNPHRFKDESFEWLQSSQIPNLRYARKNPPFKGDLHPANPNRELQEVLDSAKVNSASMFFIFGGGLGHLTHFLMSRRPHERFPVAFFELNPQIFLRSLCLYDFTPFFGQPQIFWIIERDEKRACAALHPIFHSTSLTDTNLKILATPSALKMDGARYQQIAAFILETRDFVRMSLGDSVDDTLQGLHNAVDNLPYLLNNKGILGFHNRFKGKTCISVASGPALSECFDLLREVQGRVPIICAASALRPLVAHGIAPDFVTALERIDVVTKAFRDIQYPPRACLIGAGVLLKESIEAFKGPHLLYASFGSYFKTLGLECLGVFHTGHSAGNVNIETAAMMGFSNIIMVGHNLAYGAKGEGHVKGTFDKDRQKEQTEEELKALPMAHREISQDGTQYVYTDLFYKMFQREIETVIGRNPTRKFINTALKGVRIQGTETLSLTDALQKYVQEDFDILPERLKVSEPLLASEVEARFKNSKESIESACQRIDFWRAELEKLFQKLTNWKKEIEEKESSGQRLSLETLNGAIDEVIQFKIKSVEEDRIFDRSAVNIMISIHSAFERNLNAMPPSYTDEYLLKRDILLEHEKYFQYWVKYLPKISAEYERALTLLRSSTRAEVAENWVPEMQQSQQSSPDDPKYCP